MPLECAKAHLQGVQQVLGRSRVVALLNGSPDAQVLASYVRSALGDVPISLDQVLAFVYRHRSRPHSSSASRFTAGADGLRFFGRETGQGPR
jgi:hypothetical protein